MARREHGILRPSGCARSSPSTRPGGAFPAGLERAARPRRATSRRTGRAPWGLDADPAEQLAIDEVMRELQRARAR